MALCRACGREIVWIKTKAGKSMPCDAEMKMFWEDEAGKDVIVRPDGKTVRCRLDGDPVKHTGMGYVSHFATCPYAGKFRRT